MNSIILQIAAKYIKALLILFAIIALFRGHNYPGGRFIGGLLAALAVILDGFAFSVKQVRDTLKISPGTYIAGGLFIVILSFIPSVLNHLELMQGVWLKLQVPLLGEIKLGTPFLFDIGVFFTVIGVTFLFFFSLTKVE